LPRQALLLQPKKKPFAITKHVIVEQPGRLMLRQRLVPARCSSEELPEALRAGLYLEHLRVVHRVS